MSPLTVIATWAFVASAAAGTGLSDYAAERARLEIQIGEIRDAPSSPLGPLPRETRLAVLLYRRASLSADFAELHEAELALDDALQRAPSDELFLLRAKFNLKVHRLQRARADLHAISALSAGAPVVRLLAAQISEQEGDYAGAGRAYQAVVGESGSWEGLASLAYWRAHVTSADAADDTFAAAADEITAKEMRAFAWVEVQRGVLDFERGRHAEALAHYQKADRAYSGYWLVEEHIAESLARLGRTDDAARMYRAIVERTRNPEFMSALAAIVARFDPAQAAYLAATAEQLYARQLTLYPEAATSHLVRHWLGQSDPPLERLVALARLGFEARPHADAEILLAKALWKAGDHAEARRRAARAMQAPWRSAEIKAFWDELRPGHRSTSR